MNLMHSCRQVAELLSQSMDAPLDWIDRLRLRMHLSMCSDCSAVERQLAQVRLDAQALFDDPPPLEDVAPPR
jgi:predicted anti-sigma-YlaC factor YlaD